MNPVNLPKEVAPDEHKITIFENRDSAGNIVSATGTGTSGSQVGVMFPPFPDQNSITFTKAGATNLVITQQIAQDTYTFRATVGAESFTYGFKSRGPFTVHYSPSLLSGYKVNRFNWLE
jgi:hypothetical protein